MTVGFAPSLLVIGEAFAALGYMWKSWSGHPHLNAEPAQGQVMTLIFKQPIQLDKDTQSDVSPGGQTLALYVCMWGRGCVGVGLCGCGVRLCVWVWVIMQNIS